MPETSPHPPFKRGGRISIAICAGEMSGDALGADLIKALKTIYPDATFSGIAGPRMQAQGCESLFPMDTLSVMGVAEVIPKLIPILKLRKQLIQHFIQNPPDVFIGIDSPDFMLPVEKALKNRGIKTVHYVSPTVWAWREKRVLSIKKSTDLMLCVFPFETPIYEKYGAKAHFIGHPLAESLVIARDVIARRYSDEATQFLSADEAIQSDPRHDENKTITLMPGSRSMELKHIAPTFFDVAQNLYNKNPELKFILPVVKPAFKDQLEKLYQSQNMTFPLAITIGNSRECMEAGDIILCASGTTTLEAMFMNKPMVVAYKMSAFNWWLAQRLVHVKYLAIPNLLADKKLVPEFVQDDANVENLTQAVEQWLQQHDRAAQCEALYEPFCKQLAQNASQQAAHSIKDLLDGNGLHTTTDHRP